MRRLVHVGDADPGGKNGPIGVLSGTVCRSLGGELIELSGGDARVNASDDLRAKGGWEGGEVAHTTLASKGCTLRHPAMATANLSHLLSDYRGIDVIPV